VRKPLVTFRLESEAEAERLRELAREHADDNLSALIRDALRARHPELVLLEHKAAQ
jgi:hypothetical protein